MENAIAVKYHLFELTSQMWEGGLWEVCGKMWEFERKSQFELVKISA